MSNINLFDIINLVDTFLKDKNKSISSIHNYYLKSNNKLSLRSLQEELKEELKTGAISFFNKGRPIEELDSYLFYITNAYCKKKKPKAPKKLDYVCPGCFFLGKETVIFFHNNFKCEECEENYKNAVDSKWIVFYDTFRKHNKSGFRCCKCERFIPSPLTNDNLITCPYIDCSFSGNTFSLKKMHHPTLEKFIENVSYSSLNNKDSISVSSEDISEKIENKEKILQNLKLIREIIDTQNNSISYSSSSITVKHKQLIYSAFLKLLDRNPEEMINYLLYNSRSGGFQHKLFQEYIKGLEESLPFFIFKNKKTIKISSLLDNNLSIFDGISSFDAVVKDNLEIKNNTKEFYIGNRSGSCARPFYIGKLLNIVDHNSKQSIIDNVDYYTFNKIKVKNISPGTSVTVTHLRVFPHYQMGGMVYINRIRKKIVDKARILTHNNRQHET